MTDQRTAAAERSAHVTRDARPVSDDQCCVCGGAWRICSYAARCGPPLMQVCSEACMEKAPFARG